jgi:hypothetical protein
MSEPSSKTLSNSAHTFAKIAGHTLLPDKIRFSLPLGLIGDQAARRLVAPYIADLMHQRQQMLKEIAESEGGAILSPNRYSLAASRCSRSVVRFPYASH